VTDGTARNALGQQAIAVIRNQRLFPLANGRDFTRSKPHCRGQVQHRTNATAAWRAHDESFLGRRNLEVIDANSNSCLDAMASASGATPRLPDDGPWV
jgi:hypothetical protein